MGFVSLVSTNRFPDILEEILNIMNAGWIAGPKFPNLYKNQAYFFRTNTCAGKYIKKLHSYISSA